MFLSFCQELTLIHRRDNKSVYRLSNRQYVWQFIVQTFSNTQIGHLPNVLGHDLCPSYSQCSSFLASLLPFHKLPPEICLNLP